MVLALLSKNLRHLRRSRTPRLTQERLAQALGLVPSTYGSYEEGRAEPRLDTLYRIAKYFNVSLQALLTVELSLSQEISEGTQPLALPLDDSFSGRQTSVICRPSRYVAIAGPKRHLDARDYLSGMSSVDVGALGLPSDKELRVFRVEGDSMWPVPNGALVFGAAIESLDDIVNGAACILITRSEGITFKIVYTKGSGEGMLLTAATNPRYAPYTIPLTDVDEIWSYAGHFCQDKSIKGGDE